MARDNTEEICFMEPLWRCAVTSPDRGYILRRIVSEGFALTPRVPPKNNPNPAGNTRAKVRCRFQTRPRFHESAHLQHAVACIGGVFTAGVRPCAHVCMRHDGVRPVPSGPRALHGGVRRGAALA